MRINPPTALFYAALLVAVAAISPSRAFPVAGGDAPVEAASTTAPIRSQAELDAYLRAWAGRPTPFDALPPGARERFFLSLHWGRRGLGSFDPAVLADELPQAQIDTLLRLFGDEVAAHAPRSRLPGDAPAGTPQTATEGISDLERRYNAFYRARREQDGLDAQARSTWLAERFDALLAGAYAPEALRAVDGRHLAMLWNAVASTARDTKAPRYAAAMEAVLAEGVRRTGETPPSDRLREMRDALLASHRFDEARRFVERYPDAGLRPLPDFIDSSGDGTHTAWAMAADGTSLTREPVDLSGTRILVTAGCHFSYDAAEDIATDPVLGPAFAAHAYWLMLPPGEEDIDAVRDWDHRFPQAPARMIYSRAEWPMFPDWPMPEFHIFRDGRVVDTVTGWPRGEDDNREALVEMLRRAKLLDPVETTP